MLARARAWIFFFIFIFVRILSKLFLTIFNEKNYFYIIYLYTESFFINDQFKNASYFLKKIDDKYRYITKKKIKWFKLPTLLLAQLLFIKAIYVWKEICRINCKLYWNSEIEHIALTTHTHSLHGKFLWILIMLTVKFEFELLYICIYKNLII